MQTIIKDMCERLKKYEFNEIQDYLVYMIGFLESYELDGCKELTELLEIMRKLL